MIRQPASSVELNSNMFKVTNKQDLAWCLCRMDISNSVQSQTTNFKLLQTGLRLILL